MRSAWTRSPGCFARRRCQIGIAHEAVIDAAFLTVHNNAHLFSALGSVSDESAVGTELNAVVFYPAILFAFHTVHDDAPFSANRGGIGYTQPIEAESNDTISHCLGPDRVIFFPFHVIQEDELPTITMHDKRNMLAVGSKAELSNPLIFLNRDAVQDQIGFSSPGGHIAKMTAVGAETCRASGARRPCQAEIRWPEWPNRNARINEVTDTAASGAWAWASPNTKRR